MSQQPIWETESGSLGVIPEGRFYSISLHAYDPDYPTDPTKIEYTLLAGSLPSGIQVLRDGSLEGVPISTAEFRGVPLEVAQNTTSKFTIRATSTSNRIADRTFTLTVTGQDVPEFVTPAGQIGEYCDYRLIDIQIEVDDSDTTDTLTVYLISGELPSGVEIDSDGHITGYIEGISSSTDYEFTLGVTDGKETSSRTFSIYVNATSEITDDLLLTADTTDILADETFITADLINLRFPYLTNYTSDLGTIVHNNFYAYQLIGADPDGYTLYYEIEDGELPDGLILDLDSGWIYGDLPDIGVSSVEYTFSVKIYRQLNPLVRSTSYDFTMTLVKEIQQEVIWLTSDFLGYVNNGEDSILYVQASYAGGELQYRLKSGEFSRLPQGLSLLSSGNIVGRVGFKTFSLDGGSTTFDSEYETRLDTDPTTFDLTYRIMVEAYSNNEEVTDSKEFTIIVNPINEIPYNNLYAKLMPLREDREIIKSLIGDSNIFESDLIYRSDDSNFGISKNIIYDHVYGLTPVALEDYFAAMEYNHYNKMITLGDIQTARALDDDGNVIYEVVYSQIIDDLVNEEGESVSSVVDLSADVINMGPGSILQATYSEVYPNSLENMREQMVSDVGQVSKTLPRWMLSKQENGEILGFTSAWVIAYTKPEQSDLIAYRIEQLFGDQLNAIDLELDRFILNSRLTRDWDYDSQSWLPSNMTTFDRIPSLLGITADSTHITADSNRYINPLDPEAPETADTDSVTADSDQTINTPGGYSPYARERELTAYDVPTETIFDGGGTRFISPDSTDETTDYYDQYIKFPNMKIVDNDANT